MKNTLKRTIEPSQVRLDDTNIMFTSGRHHQWVWACPNCGGETHATKEENTTPEQIAKDALCYTCRRIAAAHAQMTLWAGAGG